MDYTKESDKSPPSSDKETGSPSHKEEESEESSPSPTKDSDASQGKEVKSTEDSGEKAPEQRILRSTPQEKNPESATSEPKTDIPVKTAKKTKPKKGDDSSEASRAKKHKTVHSDSGKDVEPTKAISADCDRKGKLGSDDSISPTPESATRLSAPEATSSSTSCEDSVIKHASCCEVENESLLAHSPSDENDQTKSQTSTTGKSWEKESTSGTSDRDSDDIVIANPSFSPSTLFPDEEDMTFSPSYLNEPEPSVSNPNPDPEKATDGRVEATNSTSDENAKKDGMSTDPQPSCSHENSTKDSPKEMEVDGNQVCPYPQLDELGPGFPTTFSPSTLYPDSDEIAVSPSIYLKYVLGETPAATPENPAPHSSGDENVGGSPTNADLKRKRSTSSEE